jgi:hypothetical protein|nr:MAG TPA: hypothetical protein [Caudoviricetes sp.]
MDVIIYNSTHTKVKLFSYKRTIYKEKLTRDNFIVGAATLLLSLVSADLPPHRDQR